MGCDFNPNGSDFTIVTDVLLYGVFATLLYNMHHRGREYDASEYNGYIVTYPSIWVATLDRL